MTLSAVFTSRQLVGVVLAACLLAVLTTWPLRSRHLASWDAANFAFALDHIDIASHRPHPPGYLGYVFAGRALRPLFDDANAALVAWNVGMKAAATVLVLLLTVSASGGSLPAGIAASTILVTSPLFWFYSSQAEIYATEMTMTLAVVYAANESLRGRAHALVWMAGLLAMTALFKVSAMVLLGPAALFVWWHSDTVSQRRSATLFAALLAAVALLFFVIQPDFLRLLWAQFAGTVTPADTSTPMSGFGRALNRNARDTVVALIAAIGLVNVLLVPLVVARARRPPRIDSRLLIVWTVPWVLLVLFVHIGKPGYVLPLLPAACVVLGRWYGQQRPRVMAALLTTQTIVSVWHVGWLAPPAISTSSYREKTFVQRMASDLEGLTFPTSAQLRRSDAAVERLLATASDCGAGSWAVVTAGEPIDWRRTSYYLPHATSVRLAADGTPGDIGHGPVFMAVEGVQQMNSPCGLLWISSLPGGPAMPPGGEAIGQFGWKFSPGAGAVTRTAVTWSVSPP